MSKSDCSSETSYDSEVNFFPGFLNIEVEEATLGEEDVAEQTELDPDTYKQVQALRRRAHSIRRVGFRVSKEARNTTRIRTNASGPL